jgi:hypothetical protein
MAKIRSFEELSDFLRKDIAWRKKEISILKTKIEQAKGENQKVLLRISVAMLYAHWEGFIKNAAEAYLKYISTTLSRRQIATENISSCVRALSLWGKFRYSGSPLKPAGFIDLFQSFIESPYLPIEVPIEQVINSESNLNYSVLKDIFKIINIDKSGFETKANLIDEKLLSKRNKIVHGEREEVSLDDYDELHSTIVNLLNLFMNQVENEALDFHQKITGTVYSS